MKKTLLSIALVGISFAAIAQTVYFEEDFNDIEELSTSWTNIDADGDGFEWAIVQIEDSVGDPVFTPLLRSASWSSSAGALTPDNWIITPGIDLSAAEAGESIELTYDINAVDADWDAENYTVYVGTSADPAELLNADITFNELTLDGFNEFNEDSNRTIDVSALAGETIYVAFRHYDVSDQFTIELDNIKVESNNLSVSEVAVSKSKLYVASVGNGEYKLQLPDGFNANNTKFEIYNITGAKMKSAKVSQTLDLNSLNAGVYIIKVTDGYKTATTKFVKK